MCNLIYGVYAIQFNFADWKMLMSSTGFYDEASRLHFWERLVSEEF